MHRMKILNLIGIIFIMNLIQSCSNSLDPARITVINYSDRNIDSIVCYTSAFNRLKLVNLASGAWVTKKFAYQDTTYKGDGCFKAEFFIDGEHILQLCTAIIQMAD